MTGNSVEGEDLGIKQGSRAAFCRRIEKNTKKFGQLKEYLGRCSNSELLSTSKNFLFEARMLLCNCAQYSEEHYRLNQLVRC